MESVNYGALVEKWSPVLNVEEAVSIKDNYKKSTIALMLENQERAMKEERAQMGFLAEAAPTNATGTGVQNWDPVLISLVRRAMPNLMAYDIASVQPMSGPTGLIFAMKSRYTTQGGTEALFNEADTGFASSSYSAGTGTDEGDDLRVNTTTGQPNAGDPLQAFFGTTTDGSTANTAYSVQSGMPTADGEALGGATDFEFGEMAFSIEKTSVAAKTRALKAEYTMEIAQDLKAIHGLDAEAELANILSTEILAEINRELIGTINAKAKLGCLQSGLTDGIFDLSSDADGRWSVEKFKGLHVQIDREANTIAKETRRGKGNWIICSSDVATALAGAGVLDYAPALSTNLNVDDTGNTFAGVLNGRVRVYVDPYAPTDYVTVGFKGTNPYDAGIFYCPYVPLTMMKTIGENSFQPKIGFKTRYGMAANPFALSYSSGVAADSLGAARANPYFRIFRVDNILQTTP